jgi:hypothetical protein
MIIFMCLNYYVHMAYFEKHMEFARNILIIPVGPASGGMLISSASTI